MDSRRKQSLFTGKQTLASIEEETNAANHGLKMIRNKRFYGKLCSRCQRLVQLALHKSAQIAQIPKTKPPSSEKTDEDLTKLIPDRPVSSLEESNDPIFNELDDGAVALIEQSLPENDDIQQIYLLADALFRNDKEEFVLNETDTDVLASTVPSVLEKFVAQFGEQGSGNFEQGEGDRDEKSSEQTCGYSELSDGNLDQRYSDGEDEQGGVARKESDMHCEQINEFVEHIAGESDEVGTDGDRRGDVRQKRNFKKLESADDQRGDNSYRVKRDKEEELKGQHNETDDVAYEDESDEYGKDSGTDGEQGTEEDEDGGHSDDERHQEQINQDLNNNENPTQKRKGIVDRDNWKTMKNKRLRMEGKHYSGYKKNDETGKYEYTEREERKLGKRCDHNLDHCKMKKCCTVSDEDRQNLFDEFWKTMDWGQRKVYIASLVTYYHVPHRGRRTVTFKYNLRVNDARINVCKNMFLNTFGLKEWSVRNWVLSAKDKNGMHESYSYRKRKGDTPTANKTKISIAREFLKSLSKLPSHYSRSDSSKHYLETTIDTKRKMYEVFQNYCDSKGYPKVSIQMLSKVMNEENIAITKPKKDECNVCCSYKHNTISDEEHSLHIQRKEEAKEEKKKDKEEAQTADSDIVVLTMDLQVDLLSPRTFSNASYYKTKLSCHNFTTYNLGTREVYCYFWHEGQGEVTGNNFASCIVDQVQNIISQNVEKSPKTIILYSDGCCYQNLNFVLANALLDLSVSTGVTIIQKFLEKGHTWMEVDSVHSAIENKLRNREVYWPAEYVNIFRSARRESQYKIKYVDHTFFKNYSQLSYLSSIRPGNSVGDHVVTDICALKYSPDLKVEFKLLFSEEWQLLTRRPKARNNQFVTPLYRHPLPIKKSKWQHLQELKKVLPREYHHFYDSLPYVNQE